VYQRGNLRVRLATQYKSRRQFNLRLLVSTCESVARALDQAIRIRGPARQRQCIIFFFHPTHFTLTMLLVTQYFACGQAPAARIWPRLEELKRNKLRVKWSRGEWDEGSFSSLSLRPILDDRACSRATRGVKRYLRTLEAIKHNISSLRTARGTWPEDRRVETARETVDASANPTGGLMKVLIPAQLWHLKTTSLTPGHPSHPDQLKPKTAGQLVVASCM